MSNPANVLGASEFDGAYRQKVQDALDLLYGLIQKSQGAGAGATTFDELRVKRLTVLGTIDVVPEDKPPANEFSRLITPWFTGQRGRGMFWGFEDQNDSGGLMTFRWQPYLVGTPTATTGDYELAGYSAQRDPAGANRRLGAIRFGQDGRIRVYDATETLQFDSTLALTSSTAPLPTRYVAGLVIRRASATTLTVSAGKARDKADGANMTLSSGVTVDITTVNAALGAERKSLTGSFTFTSASSSVTVSGGSLLAEFGTRNLTGITLTSSGQTFTASASILGLIAVGDLVGHSSKGHWVVSSINSSTTFTTYTTPGSAFAGEAASVVEYPLLESAGGKVYTLRQIASSGSTIVLTNTASTTETSVAAYASSKKTNPVSTDDGWRAVWLLSGGSGTTVALSTQRTTPYLSITGYTTSYRRIGWVRINSSGNLAVSEGYDGGVTRFTSTVGATHVSNAASTTTAAAFDCSTSIPPTALRCSLLVQQISPNTVGYVLCQRRGGFAAGLNFDVGVRATSTSTTAVGHAMCALDGAQWCEHLSDTNTGDGTYIATIGWEDTLE